MNTYVTILGRQPELSMAELECLYGSKQVQPLGPEAALVEADDFDVQRVGGVLKAGVVAFTIPRSKQAQMNTIIVQHYVAKWRDIDRKVTLGLSAYQLPLSPKKVQSIGLAIKSSLKKSSTGVRLVPNTDQALSTATSHHNKLGLSEFKIELLIVRDAANGDIIVAESIGAQNITALAARDQDRPKRDAFVGMLPPKLALMMINMATPSSDQPRILDPFCGTGVVLQEALLLGYSAYGTDLSEKMVDYSKQNTAWLQQKYRLDGSATIAHGDAMTTAWEPPIDAVVSETYLGQPFSAPPSPAKLQQVVGNCNHIITTFLQNLHSQLDAGTPLCLAVPAWRHKDGGFTHLPLVRSIEKLGYAFRSLTSSDAHSLLYYREDQVVARQLLLLEKKPTLRG